MFNLGCLNGLVLESAFFEFKERYTQSAKGTGNSKHIKKSAKYNYDIGHLPILASECPGWVCYAEKTIGEEAFPFMSKVKSPQ